MLELLYREGCGAGMHRDRRRRRTTEEGAMCLPAPRDL